MHHSLHHAARHPYLSLRPKTLHIEKSISRRNAEGWQPWRRMIPLIANLVTQGGSYRQVGSIVAIAQHALSRLASVTKLNVTYDYSGACGRDPLILQLITDLWQVFADRVGFLEVRVAFENIQLRRRSNTTWMGFVGNCCPPPLLTPPSPVTNPSVTRTREEGALLLRFMLSNYRKISLNLIYYHCIQIIILEFKFLSLKSNYYH